MNSYIILKGWHLLLIIAAPAISELLTKIVWMLWKHYLKPKVKDSLLWPPSDINGNKFPAP